MFQAKLKLINLRENNAADKIQKFWVRVSNKLKFLNYKSAIRTLQRKTRKSIWKNNYFNSMARKVQSFFRMTNYKIKYNKIYNKIIVIQSFLRITLAKNKIKQIKKYNKSVESLKNNLHLLEQERMEAEKIIREQEQKRIEAEKIIHEQEQKRIEAEKLHKLEEQKRIEAEKKHIEALEKIQLEEILRKDAEKQFLLEEKLRKIEENKNAELNSENEILKINDETQKITKIKMLEEFNQTTSMILEENEKLRRMLADQRRNQCSIQ